MTSERVTEVSDFHRDVQRWVMSYEIEALEEVAFPPYRVDIYVPDFHVAIEADGSHGPNLQRDKRLLERYELPVFHVRPGLFRDKPRLMQELGTFLLEAAEDARERWDRNKLKTPWL